jgi:hypothetical protein
MDGLLETHESISHEYGISGLYVVGCSEYDGDLLPSSSQKASQLKQLSHITETSFDGSEFSWVWIPAAAACALADTYVQLLCQHLSCTNLYKTLCRHH